VLFVYFSSLLEDIDGRFAACRSKETATLPSSFHLPQIQKVFI
jgi:hypothetical protein